MGANLINLLGTAGVDILVAKTAADATGIGLMPASVCGKYVEASFYVTFSAGATAGTVLIESAPSPDYSGTWAVEGTVNWVAASKTHRVSLTMLTGAMRARISSAITLGTVTVTAFAATNS